MWEWFPRLTTVSYTHLDVYKRQDSEYLKIDSQLLIIVYTCYNLKRLRDIIFLTPLPTCFDIPLLLHISFFTLLY